MIKNMVLALSLLLFSAGNLAWADGACKKDKERLCSQCSSEDKKCIKKCMKKNKNNVSAECKKYKEEKRKSRDQRSDWDKRH